jgi:hypothetical protein
VRTKASATPIAPHAKPLRLHGFLARAVPSRATYAGAPADAIARRRLASRRVVVVVVVDECLVRSDVTSPRNDRS